MSRPFSGVDMAVYDLRPGVVLVWRYSPAIRFELRLSRRRRPAREPYIWDCHRRHIGAGTYEEENQWTKTWVDVREAMREMGPPIDVRLPG